MRSAPIQVFAQKIKTESVKQTIELPILIKSQIFSKVTAPFNGIVAEQKVRLGEKVRPGQVLLTLKNQDQSGFYKPISIRSTVKGVLSQLYVRKGEFINQGRALLLITDPQKLYGEFELPYRYKDSIRPNHQVYLSFPHQDIPLAASIDGLSQSLHEKLGSLTAHVRISDHSKLVDHLIGKVKIPLSEEQMILVPGQALFKQKNQHYLFKVENDLAKKVYVQTGRKKGNRVEILSGIKDSESIIVRQSGHIKDQDKVNITKVIQ